MAQELTIARASAARRALSPALAGELERQNRLLVPSAARDAHLAALSSPELGVVVTGQQVGLFLGPAYSLYKAASAIALARRLTRESGRPTVPIFWLQSEDHDGEEVATTAVLDDDDTLVRVHLTPLGHTRASLAARPLGEGVRHALTALREHLGEAPHRDEALALVERHYRADAGWVQAFAGALGEIFAGEGLLVLDPRTPTVAALATPIHRRALDDPETLDEALAEGAALLSRAGEPVAVRPRPGCSLSFFHPEGPTGPRHRLIQRDGGWALPHSGAPVLAPRERLEREPLSFSTSSLLRVVLQDTLLPTVAQVAGPGEARYLRQLPPLHAAFGLTSPPVVPRARFVITDRACRRRLDALGIAASEVTEREPLLRALAANDGGPRGDAVVERLTSALERELVELGPELIAVDPSLARALSRTRRHIARGAGKLGERVERARARRDATRVERVEWLCRRLRPGGAPQERALGVVHFAARYGLASLERGVFAAIDAHPGPLHEVSL